MEHPKLFAPDDALVERVREICLRYPESAEVEAWGRPTFRAGKKIFIMVGSSMDRPYTIVFKPEADARLAYAEDPRFFSPPYWGPGGWLGIDIDGGADGARVEGVGAGAGVAGRDAVDWREIAELIDASYRGVALKRQLAALDAAPLV